MQLDLLDFVDLGQLPLREPTLRGKARLEEALRTALGPRVLVTTTTNRSTMISFRARGRALYVRVHAMFESAPTPVLSALAKFISKDQISKKDATLLDEWIEQHRHHITKQRERTIQPRPRGEIYDLSEIFHALNQEYFGGQIEAQITWSNARKRKRRRSINMGTYSDELKLIRIHPALDQAFVPRYFVEAVVFHEMLHQVHDVKEERGQRRSIHPPEFRTDERRFKHFEKARRWEKRHLGKLLRY